MNSNGVLTLSYRIMVLVISGAFAVSFGGVDGYYGRDFPLLVLSLLPVFLAAWYWSFEVGICVALFNVVAWFAANGYQGTPVMPLSSWWNGFNRLVILLVFGGVVAALRRSRDAEKSLAQTDTLTGLWNARAFMERASLELARAHRTQRPFTLAYLDLDDFKGVNSRYGYAIGDTVLRSLANKLRSSVRETDLLGRVAGDEFVLLLPETGQEAAQIVAKKIQRILCDFARQNDWPLGVSLGVVTCLQPPAFKPAELVKRADAVMVAAKRSGKNAIQFEVLGATGEVGEIPALAKP